MTATGMDEYRITLDFKPRWQLLARLAEAVQAYEAEVDEEPCEVLVGGDLQGGVSLIVRCPSQGPSAVPEPVDGDGAEVASPPSVPTDGVASDAVVEGGRRRRASTSSPTDHTPGALSAMVEHLLVVLHRDFDDVALDATGRVNGRIAAAAGWTPNQTRTCVARAASIGLLRRRLNGKRCYEVALTSIGLAALDRLDLGEDEHDGDAPEPGGGVADAVGGLTAEQRDDLHERRRAAAAAAI